MSSRKKEQEKVYFLVKIYPLTQLCTYHVSNEFWFMVIDKTTERQERLPFQSFFSFVRFIFSKFVNSEMIIGYLHDFLLECSPDTVQTQRNKTFTFIRHGVLSDKEREGEGFHAPRILSLLPHLPVNLYSTQRNYFEKSNILLFTII